MKPAVVVASLACNIALLAALAFQPSLAPAASRDFFARHLHSAEFRGFLERHLHFKASDGAGAKATGNARPTASLSTAQRKLWPAFATEDLSTLSARLRAAGFPTDVIAEVIRSTVNSRYDARVRALTEPDPDAPFWKLPPPPYADPRRALQLAQLERERAKTLRDLLDAEHFPTEGLDVGQRRMWGELPRQKLDAIQRIEDDYAEMTATARLGMGGVTLPEDRERLALIERERLADIAAALTPEEFEEYKIRTPGAAKSQIISRLGSFEPSEEEFRAIYLAHQAVSMNAATGGPAIIGSGTVQFASSSVGQSGNLQQQLDARLKAALGEARFAEYARLTNSEFQQLARLTQKENLSPEIAHQAFGVRDRVASESNRIFDDPSLDVPQKQAALQALAQATRAQLLGTLGPAAGPAYVKIADSWLTNLERGSAVTFNGGNTIIMAPDDGTRTIMPIGSGSPTYRRLQPAGSPPASSGTGTPMPMLRVP